MRSAIDSVIIYDTKVTSIRFTSPRTKKIVGYSLPPEELVIGEN